MKYDELLEEQIEELYEHYEVYLHNSEDDPEFEPQTFDEYAESYDYSDSDFFCTANRENRSMDIMFPYCRDSITLYDEELRALERKRGKIIHDYDDLIDVIYSLIDNEVDKYREVA